MILESVISERGQITLPKELRDHLGLKPGTVVAFVPSDQGILIKRSSSSSSLREVFGVVKDKIPTDDYLRQIRGKKE